MCETCKFWQRVERAGECRRHTPVIIWGRGEHEKENIMDKHYIECGIEIDLDAAIELARTADADGNGYLIGHSNRKLMAGLDLAGNGWQVWIETNGGDILIDDDLPRDMERLAEVARAMSDAPDYDLNDGLSVLANIANDLESHADPESLAYWRGWCEGLPDVIEQD